MDSTATREEVFSGKVTDVYFKRSVEILRARGARKRVVMEVIAKHLPGGWKWGVLGGVEEGIELLSTLPVRASGFPEGSVFYPWEPVLAIEGFYDDFGVYETALLGILCQATGIMTAAARCRKAAGSRAVISFGARRMHPAISPMIERAAYAGGCDGVSTVAAAARLGIAASGTMPHALCLLMGSTAEAVRAFDEVIEKTVPRVALVDTFGDEKFEAVAAAEAVGGKLFAVRLDTPASRRGDFRRILQEVRWELDIRGFKDVKIFVSGGIDEDSIRELNDFADGYGVGTHISAAPTVDFALDIVEIDGKPFAKRGKESGRKDVIACDNCQTRKIMPALPPDSSMRPRCGCSGEFRSLIQPLCADGKRISPEQSIDAIRKRVAAETKDLEL